MKDQVTISNSEGILHIRMNRPDKLNALTLAMYQTMADSINAANDDDSVKVILISGDGDAFCSGNDLRDFMQNPPRDETSSVFQFIHALVHAQKPMVAAVNGVAVGIGTTMLLHCDLVYASKAASFSLPFVHLGLCAEAGASYLLPRLCGHQKAAELTLLGAPFDAQQAQAIGLITQVLSPHELMDCAMKNCHKLAGTPADAVQTTRALLKAPIKEELLQAIRQESEQFIRLLNQDDAKQIIQQFLNR